MLKKLGGNIVIYGATNGIKSLVPFVMLPILTAYLSVKDYGILSLIEVTILFLTPFVTLNINSAINVEYFNLEKKELAKYISNALLLNIFATIIVLFIFFILKNKITIWLNLEDDFIVLLLPIFALLRVVSMVVLGLYQVSGKPISYALYTLMQTVIDFTLSYILVVIYKFGYLGRLEGVYIAFAISTIYGVYVLYSKNYLIFKVIFKYSKEILSYGVPLIPHVLGGVILAMSDRYFISYFISNKEVGYYSVAYQMGAIMLLLSVSVNQAWTPMLYKMLKNYNSNSKTIFKYSYYLIGIYSLFALLLYIFSDTIFALLVDTKFYKAKEFFSILLIGFLFQSYYYLFTNFLFFYKKTMLLAKITFFSALLNLILNYILIKVYGTIGVAFATAITYVVYLFIVIYFVINTIKEEKPN